MSPARTILAGVLAGFATTVLVIAAIAVGGPAPVPPAASPSDPGTGVLPSPSASATPVPGSPSASPSGEPSPTGDPSDAAFRVGQPAPALRLPQLGGGTFDLAALTGRPIWIQFTATWCPSCRDDATAMGSFFQRYGDDGLVVVAIDVREDVTTVAAFATTNGIDHPIALDSDGSVARDWGAIALPTHYFIDATGTIRGGAVGTVGRDLLATRIGAILPGVAVEP